jgi:Ca2+-binding EF-hand superfamily protein
LLDGDNKGYIEFEEFLRACIDKKTILTNTYLKYAFKFLDKEKSGTLNTAKIIKAFILKPNKILEAVFNISKIFFKGKLGDICLFFLVIFP